MGDGSMDVNLKSLEQSYVEGNYQVVLDGILSLKTTLSPGQFHYNLGTVYGKMGKYAASRFHLEKSISEGYVSSKVLNNLSFVKQQIQVDDSNLGLWDQSLMVLSPHSFYFYLLISLILIMNFLLLVRFKKIKSKLVIGLFCALSLTPISLKMFYLDKLSFAIAMEDTQVFEGPSKVYSNIGVLKAGTKALVKSGGDGWFYIESPSHYAGWISKSTLGLYK
jgi:hypothetical protein